MATPDPRSSACVTSPPRLSRYRWFVRLCAAAVASAALPAALLHATPSAIGGFGGIAPLACLAGSFAIWQAALVFLVRRAAKSPPGMFICGNDEAAKKTVSAILDQFGWETADMGKAEAARATEPLCILWCIPGFLRNEWAHAFRLLT